MVYMHWYIRLPFGLVISVVVFMVVLLAIYVIVYRKIGVVRWLAQFFGLQGWKSVEGARQTWFITSLLLWLHY